MKMLRGMIIYCVGIFIVAMGVVLAIKTNLGVSPVSSFPYVVSLITGVDIGVCTTGVLSLFIVIQKILLGKQFKMSRWLQIASASIFGTFVSVISNATSFLVIGDNYALRLVCCLISIVILSIGIYIYLLPGFWALPAEGTMQAISERFGIPFHRSKVIFDCSMVITSVLLSFVCLGRLEGVREGTILAACFVGAGLKVVQKVATKFKKTEAVQC